ncbi:MAG TPA: family 10 glycosylhydrolase [Anaerolineae bacterium]|nr:family 10 glycosylhydrolase [Anaerolineae bacterium]
MTGFIVPVYTSAMLPFRSQLLRVTFMAICSIAIGLSIQFALAQSLSPSQDDASAFRRPERALEGGAISFTPTYTIDLPLILQNYPVMHEVRALWISRFDWTTSHHTVTTTDIDTIVNNVASAHFNMILFQIRGTADAFYSSTLEPWASRLTGEVTRTLGQSPGFDPLAVMIDRAHAQGIQVHAYMNVYPTWLCDSIGPITNTTPQHPFWQWTAQSPSTYGSKTFFWREWSNTSLQPMNLIPTSQGGTCGSPDYLGGYLWASPAVTIVQSHILSVAIDLATRYDIDGLHLDNVRYSGSNYSSDPTTHQAFTAVHTLSPTLVYTTWLPNFQRAQVSNLVVQIYSATTAEKPNLWISAAVWPNYTSGTNTYFQDSKGWLANGSVDANMPMLYSSDVINDLSAWTNRAQDFVNDAHGRYIIPGISGDYTNFNDIVDRINAARSIGAAGVAVFSYGALNARNYWDDLANGPFATPAIIPQPNWK